MSHQIINKTGQDLAEVESFIGEFYPYAQKRLNIDQPVTIILRSDSQNAQRILGTTGYYDPENNKVVVYVDNRHPKDILRSISHELIHHAQNCRGEFDDSSGLGAGYAQADDHMRKMEMEAYLLSNGDDLMVFRDFEDDIKKRSELMSESKKYDDLRQKIAEIVRNNENKTKRAPVRRPSTPKKANKVSDQQWYQQELYKKLAEKWSK